jgi:hypothetical protein
MAQFFVNRGGGRVPEGPFEEAQIIRLILAGKVRSGHVCEVGMQRFTPLESHPPFAKALAEAGQAPTPAVAASQIAPSSKKNNRGLLLGALLAVFGLALAAMTLSAYVMFNNGGMPARGAVPSDTELLLEVTSVPQLLADLSAVRVLDPSKLASKQLLDDAATDLSQSFGVSKSRADELILTASSLGVAGRKLSSAPEGGVLLTFSSAGPCNAFVSSKRFTYTGLVAKNGRKYKLSAATPEPGASVGGTSRALSALSLDSQTNVLVWFETSKVLFVGSQSFADSVAHLLSLDAPSIEQNQSFRDAQHDFSGKPDAIGYLDTAKLSGFSDARAKALLDGYLKGTGPITASVKWVPAGLLTRFVGRSAGVEHVNRVPLAPALPLTVIDRLPAETFAYAAAVTKSQLSGAELQKLMLEQLSATDPQTAAQVGAGISQIEQRLHVHFEEILGSIGDQAALAVLAPADYSLTLAEPQQMLANFAVVYLQALKDETPFRALAKQLKTELASSQSQFKIQEDADGYLLTPTDNALGVSAELRFSNGFLFLGLGSSALVERSRRAFAAGENTLASDPAHRAARAALPSATQIFIWVDAGRIVETLQKNPLLAARVSPFDLSAVRWAGPDRVTAALAVSAELQSGVATYHVDTLNLPVFGGAFGLGLP